MKVKEVLESVCLYLDLYDEFLPLFNGESLTEEVKLEYKKMLLAINNTTQELSYKILKNKAKEDVLFVSNTFNKNMLTKQAIEIIEVKNNNKKLKFKIFGNNIECNTTKAEITYTYLPQLVSSLEDEIVTDNRLSLKAFVLGVISEYNNINGLFDDSLAFQEKFLKAVNECLKPNRNFKLPKRRWF